MNRRFVFPLFLFASLLIPSLASAQSVPRTVLVEEGTNWGCGPCAMYNPGLESFLNQHEGSIIHVAYHPGFPAGNDPMYLNDLNDNNGRISYYGIDAPGEGVPAVTFNGCHIFNPGNAGYLEPTFDSCAAIQSPVALSVSRNVNGSTVSVHVAIHPVASLSSYTRLYLRVAAVEAYVPGPGPNGEKRYLHVMRAMMPNYTGTLVHLKTGDTAFDFSYPLNSSYNASNMYEVAFLQNDANHDVLQAATDAPQLVLTPQSISGLVQRASGTSADFPFTLNSSFTNAVTATIKFFSTSKTVWPISINGIQFSGTQTLGVSPGAAQSLDVTVQIGSGSYMSGILAVSTIQNGDTVTASYPIKVISPAAKVAFVDVSDDSVRSSYTQSTLDALNLPYAPLTSNEAANINGWSATTFPEMVLVANKWIITGNDKARVQQYLQSGGKLFVTGGEIGFGLADAQSSASDRDLNFLKYTLHATYVKDSAGPTTVHGVLNDPVTGTFANSNIDIYALKVDESSDRSSLNQPDEIKPAQGAVPIFYYGSGTAQCGGIRWDSAGTMLAYLSFGLQNCSNPDRAAITTAIFNWFESANGVSSISNNALSIEPNYPNPFTGSTELTFTTPENGPVRISIVDARGTEVSVPLDAVEQAGSHSIPLDLKQLPAGPYFSIVRTPNGSCIRAMTKQ